MSGLERLRVDWLLHSPSPYNDHLFRALAADGEIDLHVHYEHERSGGHEWTGLRKGYRSDLYRRHLGIDWRLLRERRGFRVFDNWSDPTSLLAMLSSEDFAIWTDTPDPRDRGVIQSAVRGALLRRVFQKAHAVMATGVPAMDALERMGCPAAKLVNFPYFIDQKQFANERTYGGDRVIFASAGRLERIKGYDVALTALRALLINEPNFLFRIGGLGPEMGALKDQIRHLGIDSKVVFEGWISPADLPAFYASSDVFVHPARFEPYGVAVLEAMASGMVVITSDGTAAAVDRIRHGVNGFLYGDDLAGCIDDVMKRRDDWPAVGRAAQQTAEEWPVERGVAIFKQMLYSADIRRLRG